VGVVGSVAPQLIGGVSLIGVMLWMARLLFITQRQATTANAHYTAEIERLNKDHDAELLELRTSRSEDIETLKRQVAALQASMAELHAKYDAERELRRAAEDRAAVAERRAGPRHG